MATLRRVDRVREAISDFKALIRHRYPEAGFQVVKGYDPPGTYLEVSVDRDDFDETFEEIFKTIHDRLVELMDEGPLPLYVMPVERQAAAV
jgi:hypothetical protein